MSNPHQPAQRSTANLAPPHGFPALGPAPRTTRRRWLKRAGLAAAASAAGVVANTFWVEPHWVEFVDRELPIAGLPRHWQGRRVAQLSDIHVGHQVSDAYLLESFARVADATPDVVVVTGDFVSADRDGRMPFQQARAVYRRLPLGKIATLGVLGNHDYGIAYHDDSTARELAKVLADLGIRILRNESALCDGLEFVGLDDLWAGRCDGRAAFASARHAAARLVLCHNPDAADRDMWHGYQGWILAGHTHGGQCKPPFLPPPLLPVANRRYIAGQVDLSDGRKLYINRGLGHLLKVRFNVRPEITLFKLVAA
jgi:predicted MPP superfamily phosphohydrolase